MIKNYIKQKILEHAVSIERFGMNDLTWEKEAAKKIITFLLQENIGILGGSVYKIDSERLIPMYDNWSSEPDTKESSHEFFLRSKIKALDYIEKYPVYPEEVILFSLVFTENIDFTDSLDPN